LATSLGAEASRAAKSSGCQARPAIAPRANSIASRGPAADQPDRHAACHALIGSVNTHDRDWRASVEQLDARGRCSDVLEAMVGLCLPLERFEDALEFGGVKARLQFD
jgi:hypothetical protein